MIESEELRCGISSNMARANQEKVDKIVLQRETEAKILRRGRENTAGVQIPSCGSEPEDCFLDETRHVYMCDVFEQRSSKIKRLNDLAQKGTSQGTFNWAFAWGLLSSTNLYSFIWHLLRIFTCRFQIRIFNSFVYPLHQGRQVKCSWGSTLCLVDEELWWQWWMGSPDPISRWWLRLASPADCREASLESLIVWVLPSIPTCPGCWGSVPNKQFSNTSWLSYNSTWFWPYLPWDNFRFHELTLVCACCFLFHHNSYHPYHPSFFPFSTSSALSRWTCVHPLNPCPHPNLGLPTPEMRLGTYWRKQ